MLQLSSFLERFLRLAPTESITRNAVTATVEELCGILLREQDIRIQRGVVLLTVHPIHKNEILLRKGDILLNLKEKHLVLISDVR